MYHYTLITQYDLDAWRFKQGRVCQTDEQAINRYIIYAHWLDTSSSDIYIK